MRNIVGDGNILLNVVDMSRTLKRFSWGDIVGRISRRLAI